MEPKRKLYALIIDDDKNFTDIISIVLKKLGLDVIISTTPMDFFIKLGAMKPDICIIDLNLGELGSGFDIVERVRKELGQKTPIFVVSGSVDRQSIAHAIEIGANDFILKPIVNKIDNEVLANKLSRYFQSDAIRESKLVYTDVPVDLSEASLTVSFKVEEVDEFGIKVVSEHLLKKGTAVKVSGKFIQELMGTEKDQLLTATSTWVNKEGIPFGAYLEFEGIDKDTHQNVRKWLVSHVPS